MSRIDRLKEYSAPMKGPHGAASDEANIDAWSDRATANSKIAPRASDGPMKLLSTGKTMVVRDTGSKPFASRNVDRKMAGKDDPNNVGSSQFMPGVRREA